MDASVQLAGVILGILVSLTGLVITGAKVVSKLKARWLSEADAMRAQRELTEAVQTLSGHMEAVSERLDAIDARLRKGGL